MIANRIGSNDSPYRAPILFDLKKDVSLFMYIGYHAANKNVVTDSYSLPCIDKILTRIKEAQYFQSLDLRYGYHQLQIAL